MSTLAHLDRTLRALEPEVEDLRRESRLSEELLVELRQKAALDQDPDYRRARGMAWLAARGGS